MPAIDTSVLVDRFYDPPIPSINPATGHAEEIAVEWLWDIGFLRTSRQEEHLRAFKFGLYHGIATPDVDLEHLVLGLKWFCWGSLSDDQFDNYDWGEREHRLRGVLREIRAILDGRTVSEPPANPVVAGFADFWPSLTAELGDRGRQRITGHFLDYVYAIAYQNAYHAAGRVPDAATFLMMRRHTIAMVFQADVLAVVSSLSLPEALWDSLQFRELVWCFADITAWHNDVYGLEKDIADGQTCNMVRVVAASEGCTLGQAVERVLERAKERQRIFLQIQEQLPELVRELNLPPDTAARSLRLSRYLRAYAFANLVWIKETRRYDLDLPRIKGTFDDVLTPG